MKKTNWYQWSVTSALVIVILTVVVCNPLTARQVQAQTREREDPRGLDRYTLTGERAPLSIFTLPRYDPRDPDFFDGFGRATAEDLNLTDADFYNEFGNRAERGRLHPKAVIRYKNGFQWDEAYLEGCLKNGKVYFNRIKLVKKPVVKTPPVVKEMCVNFPIAVADVPRDWTVKTEANGAKSCHYPVITNTVVEEKIVEKTVDNTCKPGMNQRLVDYHSKKGFDPVAIIREKLGAEHQERILSLMAIPEAAAKVTSLIIYSNGCDYAVYVYSTVSKGMGWWKWVIPALIVGAFLLGYYLNRDKKITPIKSTPSGPGVSPVPIRPRITF